MIHGQPIAFGGGGNELIVTAPTGSTVTATKDGKTKRATEKNGVFTFSGLEAGEWTVTATLDGKTVSTGVTVSAETAKLVYGAIASTTPIGGVTYINGISDIDAAALNRYAEAISNNNAITAETSVVYVDYDNDHRKISVGDQINLSLNGTSYTFDVIGFNHDTLTTATAYGAATETGKAGITLQMHDVFATPYPMASSESNLNNWKDSTMRTSTLVTLKGYLPDDWESIIKPVNKKAGSGGTSTSVESVSDSCFLLAEIEVFGSTSVSVAGEGSQYAYYKAGNSKVKKRSSTAVNWWERSPYGGMPRRVCYVNADGTADYGNHSATGNYVAFAFCV